MQSISQTSSNRDKFCQNNTIIVIIVIFNSIDTQDQLQKFEKISKIILLTQQEKYNGSMLMFATHINKDYHSGMYINSVLVYTYNVVFQ